MTEPATKSPPKTTPPFDTSQWEQVLRDIETRAKNHSSLAQRFSHGIATVILVGFGGFVFAGTIAAMDEIDFYGQTHAISIKLSTAQAMLEKLAPQTAEKSTSSPADPTQIQATLSAITDAAKATSQLENILRPDKKELEEVHRRHLISTVTTRISAASLLAFLVAILANLYRHNVRLSAFYNSRLDALRLSKDTGLTSFERLSKGLLPDGLDVGKGPETPTKQALEFIKAISKATDSESKSAKKSA